MGIPMVVKKAFRPGGSNSPELAVGSPFEASGLSQARTFRALGFAEDVPHQVQTYETRHMSAEDDEISSDSAPKAKPAAKRAYKTRRLTAK